MFVGEEDGSIEIKIIQMGKKLVNINRHKDDREDEITNKDVQTHIINMFNML